MNAPLAGTEPRTRPIVLLVDDDADLLALISMRIGSAGYEVVAVSSAEEALAQVASARPDLVVTDLRMPGMDGLALFERLRRISPSLPVIILTAHGTIPDAVSAMQNGLFGFLTKPFDSSELLLRIRQAIDWSPTGGQAPADWQHGIVTRSSIMQELLERTRRVADSQASVMLLGASGTGKELLAKAIHLASPRRDQAFVAVNCAAIPEPLLESELFGHVRGAFTGAVQSSKGLFQAADRGTLFLDEIGDMPIGLQSKLLRVLQERSVRPVGALAPIPIDVRIVSATHRDLAKAIAEGAFREDLYYRLNVVSLALPSLSERREDIALLAAHFMRETALQNRRPVPHLAPDAMEMLVKAAWPGNVRQLANVIEHAVTLATTPVISAALIAQALSEEVGEALSFDEARRRFEYDYLVQLLKSSHGNVARAARIAQRNRTEFYKLLARHSLEPGLFKPPLG